MKQRPLKGADASGQAPGRGRCSVARRLSAQGGFLDSGFCILMPSLAKRVFSRLPMARSTRAYDFLSNHVVNHVPVPPAPRLLDLGAGQGNGTAYLSRRFPQATVLGLAINLECLRREELEIGSAPPVFVQANGLSFPLASNSLHGITAVMTFHCLPQPQQILTEAARTLRPGGWMVIADVNGRHRMARHLNRAIERCL